MRGVFLPPTLCTVCVVSNSDVVVKFARTWFKFDIMYPSSSWSHIASIREHRLENATPPSYLWGVFLFLQFNSVLTATYCPNPTPLVHAFNTFTVHLTIDKKVPSEWHGLVFVSLEFLVHLHGPLLLFCCLLISVHYVMNSLIKY